MLEPDSTARAAPSGSQPPASGLGPHALQILMSEHWSLLASRSLDLGTAGALALGGAACLVSLGAFFAWGRRQIARGLASLDPRFQAPTPDDV